MIYYIELKKNITEHSKKIKSLQNQIEDLVLKEVLTSRFDFNENNISNGNIDDTWKTVKTSRNNTVNKKESTTGDLILLMSVININLFLSTKMK